MKYTYPKIEGWMSEQELEWLFQKATSYKDIVEVGSFKGLSTHALLSGTEGKVTAIDNWELNWREDHPHYGETVFKEFKENLKEFKNLEIVCANQNNAVGKFKDNSLDMVFLDFTTDKNTLVNAIKSWLPKVKESGIICGHEYSDKWQGVKDAVNEIFGEPDGVLDTIWYKKI